MGIDVNVIVNEFSGSGLSDVGQELGVLFHKASGEFDPNKIQPDNVAFSSIMSDGSFIGYGVYVSGPANEVSSYKDVVSTYNP
ncbi:MULTISPECIES: hypothetical protein [Aquimarina]|uniref:hypothetical protein n=1 Tax=Aquimarina TaxID=290174 RepID=UPI0009447FEB|nr:MULTISPECIES: hypothetical protein [Aquimarina]